MPEARAFRRAGRGKSAPPVRRGESGSRLGRRPLSYSTGSESGAEPRPSGSGWYGYFVTVHKDRRGRACPARAADPANPRGQGASVFSSFGWTFCSAASNACAKEARLTGAAASAPMPRGSGFSGAFHSGPVTGSSDSTPRPKYRPLWYSRVAPAGLTRRAVSASSSAFLYREYAAAAPIAIHPAEKMTSPAIELTGMSTRLSAGRKLSFSGNGARFSCALPVSFRARLILQAAHWPLHWLMTE